MKNITMYILITLIITANSCDKEKEPKTYYVNENFSIDYDEAVIVIDTSNGQNQQYCVRFNSVTEEQREIWENCAFQGPGYVRVSLSISKNNETVTKPNFTYPGCTEMISNPQSGSTSRLDTFGITLYCLRVDPHPKVANPSPKAEDYSAIILVTNP